jgi:hypothetical protein
MAIGWPTVRLQMNVKQALEQDAKTEIAISDRVHLQEESSLGLRGIGGAAPATGESRTR